MATQALTPKQQAFCLAYIETGNASEAYRRSYNASKMKPETVNRTAKELLDHPKISARLDELRVHHAERHDVTVDDIRRMLIEDRDFARKLETPSSAVAATMGLAKLYGHLTEKVETKHSGSVEVTSKDQRDAAVAAALRADR